MLKFIKSFWPQLFLFIVLVFLCSRNYSPGTFLTGWDNLHPEFNILANIKRSVFSTWQEYQGLGLLAGMAHSTDLIRQLFILPLTFVLPINLIRYLWHFSMLFLGTFGLFYLSIYITKNKYASLIASLFYLLNFGTVQYFHLPFDPYSTFWGFFPWLIYTLFLYIDQPSKKTLGWLLLINLLAIPSFYVQTLFVVYFICVLIILFFSLKQIATNLKIILLILAINSFWLLPNIYFTLTKVSVTQNSMMNLMVTDQFIEQNQYRGNINSFLMLQGQYYDIKQYIDSSNKYVMQVWHDYQVNPIIIAISTLLIVTSLLSVFSKNKYKKYILTILLFGLIGFLCNTIPFNFINNLLREIPIINQIFRNSFTKLLVPTIFSVSILLGITLSRLKKLNLFFIPLIFILSWPSFSGNFINPKMRVNIPTQYFQLTNYLNTKDSNKRILDLPQYNYWGWNNYAWGSVGSGFLWYGVDQPITSRTFDVWDNNLENLYWQLHYALLKQDPLLFENILNKYNISYILFDDSLYFPEAHNSGKVSLENQKMVDALPSLILEKQFGFLKLYHYNPMSIVFTTNSYVDLTNIKIQNNHPNILSPPPLNPRWIPCSAQNNIHPISAVNQETAVFVNCGPNLDLSQNYVVKIISKNISSRPLLYKVFSLQDNRLIIDSKLSTTPEPQYIYIPNIYPFDQGIGINFSSLSFSNSASVNDLISVEISTTDSNFYNTNNNIINKNEVTNVSHPNQTFYKTTIRTADKYIILPQSFSPGWLAFYFDGLKIKFLPDHVLINNWANGWFIRRSDNVGGTITVYLFFWPQILEFLGFGLLFGTFIWVIKKR